jgi:hypothetical protein
MNTQTLEQNEQHLKQLELKLEELQLVFIYLFKINFFLKYLIISF